ncbi:MAG: glycosyltransferase family 4 protein [Phycisphaeraceae bacterium]|nr:glycosyltransferase family 4 protein [Phycisphaeraceae bacterium]
MNVLVTDSVRDLASFRWPEGRDPGRRRVVFVSVDALGWSTYGRMLAEHAGRRQDMECLHILLRPTLWFRAAVRQMWRPWGRGQLLNDFSARSLLVWREVMRRLDLTTVDQVHFSPASFGMCVAQSRVKPYTCSIDATGELYWRQRGAAGVPPKNLAAERMIYQNASAVIAWSQWVYDSLLEDYRLPAGKALVAHPAPDFSDEALAGPRVGVTGLLRLLFVGNDWERKGGPRLLRWHQERWSDRAELWVASGKAPADGSCRNVKWLGAVSHDRLIEEVFPSADVFVFPTHFDQLGIVLAEAAGAGLPAVSSRMAGTPDMVREGETGYLIEPEDEAGFVGAIERLLTDEPLRVRMSLAARKFARETLNGRAQFGRMFDHMLSVVEPVGAGTGRGRATPARGGWAGKVLATRA